MKQKVLMVTWIDSFGCPAGWVFAEDAKLACAEVTSVGVLMRKTKEFLFLAPHVSNPGKNGGVQIAGHIAIPRRQVTSVKKLTFS